MSTQGVFAQGGVCPGVSAQGGVCPGGCLVDTPLVNRMTDACENESLLWKLKSIIYLYLVNSILNTSGEGCFLT